MARVSVIIPSYNSTRTLAVCLESVAQQTYSPVEVIVVDDCSTDGSAQIAESMGVRVLRTAVNSGQCAARNLGAEHATGDVLFFLDADIGLDTGGVAAAVMAFQADPRLGALSGVLDLEPLLSNSPAAHYRALQMHHFWLKHDTPTSGPHVCMFAIRREVFAEVGPFNPNLRHTEPAEYRDRLKQRHTMRICREVHGRHDHQDALRDLLPKVFTRARMSLLEYRRGGELGGTASRALASALVLGALAALPLPVLLGAPALAVAPVLAAAAVALDAATYREVFASRGPLFGCYFVGAHLLFQATAAAGALTGLLQRALSPPRPPAGVPQALSTSDQP